jgi:Ras-related protein Ral-A
VIDFYFKKTNLSFYSEQITRVKSSGLNIPAILVGNKIDLADKRQVTPEDAEQKARSWSIRYIETSAKTKQNVDKVFCELMRIVRPFKSTTKDSDGDGNRHPMDSTHTERDNKCCVIL